MPTIPEQMQAMTFNGAGGVEVIQCETRPTPRPRAGEVLVRVRAIGLNRADVMQRRGHYPPPPGASDIPGLEVSGTVVAHASSDTETDWPVGTPVCALLAGGGYAEYVTVPVGQLLPVPASVTVEEAAALPEVAATVISNLSLTVEVQEGDWVLVHGGSGGIGTFALQYLASIGANTIATGSTSEKLRWAEEHGAQYTINYREENFPERVREVTGGRGVDAILDVVGAKYLEPNIRALADGGRLVIIGLQGGAKAELPIGELLAKRAGVIATALRSRPLAEKAEIVRLVTDRVWPLIEQGTVSVPVDRTFPLSEASGAHEYFDSGEHRGKILLTTR